MFDNIILISIILLISFNTFNCSKAYTAAEIAKLMDDNLKSNSLKKYYMTIDPDRLLEDMKYRMITKYHEILNNKYNLNIVVVLAKKLKVYENSTFIEELHKEVAKPKKLKSKQGLIITMTTETKDLQIEATEELKPVFTDEIIVKLINKMKPTFKDDDWFSNIFELLKKIHIMYQQHNFHVPITDL